MDLTRDISSGAEIKNYLQNFYEKNILVFIWFRTYQGELPLNGALPDTNSNSNIPRAQISILQSYGLF